MRPCSPGGLGAPAGEVVELAGTLYRRYRLPCPGTRSRSIRFFTTIGEDFGPTRRMLNVANTGSCPCAIFIGSFNGSGRDLGTHMIMPGEVLPVFEAPPEAAIVAVGCSGRCQSEGCFGEVTIAEPVA